MKSGCLCRVRLDSLLPQVQSSLSLELFHPHHITAKKQEQLSQTTTFSEIHLNWCCEMHTRTKTMVREEY